MSRGPACGRGIATATFQTSETIMNAPAIPPSPYSSAIGKSNIESHTLSVLVDNEPGVLARVVGLFSGRGYNIESLTVAEVAHGEHLSRITIVTSGTPEVIEQISHQLERIVPIHKVTDLSLHARAIERELAMVKVKGRGENRNEALRLAEAFKAKLIDATIESFIFELTGAPKKIDDFVEIMRPIGLVEVSRTGVAAITRGVDVRGRGRSGARVRHPQAAGHHGKEGCAEENANRTDDGDQRLIVAGREDQARQEDRGGQGEDQELRRGEVALGEFRPLAVGQAHDGMGRPADEVDVGVH